MGCTVKLLITWHETVDELREREQRHGTGINPTAENNQRSLTFRPSFTHRIRNAPRNHSMSCSRYTEHDLHRGMYVIYANVYTCNDRKRWQR